LESKQRTLESDETSGFSQPISGNFKRPTKMEVSRKHYTATAAVVHRLYLWSEHREGLHSKWLILTSDAFSWGFAELAQELVP